MKRQFMLATETAPAPTTAPPKTEPKKRESPLKIPKTLPTGPPPAKA